MEINKDMQHQSFIMDCPVKTPVYTNDLDGSIKGRFNNFISTLILSEPQNDICYLVADQLVKLSENLDENIREKLNSSLSFEKAIEEHEILFVFSNEKGINFISIDMDGDIMISVTPFQGEGGRYFQNYTEGIDAESAILTLLS